MNESELRRLRSLELLTRLRRIEESNALHRMAKTQKMVEALEAKVRSIRHRWRHLSAIDPVCAQQIRDRRFLDSLLEKERRFAAELEILERDRQKQQERFEIARSRAKTTDDIRLRQAEEAARQRRGRIDRETEDLGTASRRAKDEA